MFLASLVIEGILERAALLRCEVLGWAGDQAKIFLWRRELFPVPAALVAEEAAQTVLSLALQQSQNVEGALHAAVRKLAAVALAPGDRKPLPAEVTQLAAATGAADRYWGSLGGVFSQFLLQLGVEPEVAARMWRTALRTEAQDAFVAARELLGAGARGLKGAALAEALLRRELREVLPEDTGAGVGQEVFT